MRSKFWLLLYWLMFCSAAGSPLMAGELSGDNDVEGSAGREPVTAGAVRNGCIASYLIRRVSFEDDRNGVLELVGGQRVRLALRNTCSGIRFNGYVHKPVNRRFCEGDTLRVMESGGLCRVERLESLGREVEGASHTHRGEKSR